MFYGWQVDPHILRELSVKAWDQKDQVYKLLGTLLAIHQLHVFLIFQSNVTQ